MLVIVLSNLMRCFTKKSFCHQGFFAVKRRAVFILGATWIALVRGWRRDCAVGGMETCFQWRKAHSHTAKCEAFHVAPRLFFRFLFLIPFTIRQQCTIYPPVIFHWTHFFWNAKHVAPYLSQKTSGKQGKSGCKTSGKPENLGDFGKKSLSLWVTKIKNYITDE